MHGRRKGSAGLIVSGLLGFLCAVVLSVLFYATMAYQLTDPTRGAGGEDAGASAAPMQRMAEPDGHALFPGPVLSLAGLTLSSEQVGDVVIGDMTCRVLTRSYQRDDGATVRAISATPGAYVQRFAQEAWLPQLITGFTIGSLDAVYALRGRDAVLYAGEGETIYAIEAPADEQGMAALGASAVLGS